MREFSETNGNVECFPTNDVSATSFSSFFNLSHYFEHGVRHV